MTRAATHASLADFLRTRIAEDDDRWRAEYEAKLDIIEYTEALAACSEHSTERTEGCDECTLAQKVEMYDLQILGRLAIPYAAHPDYREEWRP